jgi:hypothetical protein
MKIKNVSGQFWTGECWGVECAAMEYKDYELRYVDLVANNGEVMYLYDYTSQPYNWVWETEDGEYAARCV